MTIPAKLYKYRKFDVKALKIITNHGLYYANPKKFNDPLDCELFVEPVISLRKLSALLKAIMGLDRVHQWKTEVIDAIYHAEEYGSIKYKGAAREHLKGTLVDSIAREIRKEFDTYGVLSFSASWQSVLMWSHYADEHRGICLELDTTELPHERLRPVRYDLDRSVKDSEIYKWKVEGNEDAGQRAFDTHFYAKAPDWQYEQEWRDIGDRPGECGNYRITAVYFGFRCDYAAKVAIAKMLGAETKVNLFDIRLNSRSFEVYSTPIDIHKIDRNGMREPSEIEVSHLMAMFDTLDIESDDEESK